MGLSYSARFSRENGLLDIVEKVVHEDHYHDSRPEPVVKRHIVSCGKYCPDYKTKECPNGRDQVQWSPTKFIDVEAENSVDSKVEDCQATVN